MPDRKQAEIVATRTPHTDLVLVCRKCSKKLRGGFGEDGSTALSRTLKQSLRAAGRRSSTRIVDTKCLGLCPRGAVAVLASRDPGRLLAVPPATEPAALIATLLPPP